MSKRVIIVDDDRSLRNNLRAELQDAGFEAQVAESGLRLLRSLRVDRPDLILLDVMTSWADCFELCRALKKNPEFTTIPVFFLAGEASGQDKAKGYQSGGAEFFVKPLDYPRLVERIRQEIGEP